MRTEQIKINTKPCPFCGCDDIVETHNWWTEGKNMFHMIQVGCRRCGVRTSPEDDLGKALEKWERRVSNDQD